MQKIGITGSIGSGKSTVGEYLKKKNFAVVDADALVKEIYLNPEFVEKMVEAFGDIRLAENPALLDKKKIFELVFSDRNQLERLDRLIHPFIYAKMMENIEALKGERVIFFDIPLLFEKGYNRMMDKVIMVYCEDAIRWGRASKRSNKSIEAIRSVDRMQMPQDEKKLRADFILDNSTSIESLEAQVRALLQRLGLT